MTPWLLPCGSVNPEAASLQEGCLRGGSAAQGAGLGREGVARVLEPEVRRGSWELGGWGVGAVGRAQRGHVPGGHNVLSLGALWSTGQGTVNCSCTD